ncbi:MAG: FAD-dependent thymidylate synthase [Thermoleophilia bacterium]|nr:FAD-dependent thymidylate synthase [Thermoleophilia bacterium]
MAAGREIRLFEHGFVRLDDAMASDLSVVNSARVSFAKRRETMEEADAGLVRFLMRDRHGTPFEHNAFRFHVRCPLFVAREWFRHRIGSFNEESARYHQLEPDFYVPAAADVRSQVGKPGAYTFEPVEPALAESVRADLARQYRKAYALYEELLARGLAKELARCVLPMGTFTQFYWTVNARSLMNFLSLRAADTAQLEIRRYAEALETFLAELMPVTYEAWLANGRVAP